MLVTNLLGARVRVTGGNTRRKVEETDEGEVKGGLGLAGAVSDFFKEIGCVCAIYFKNDVVYALVSLDLGPTIEFEMEDLNVLRFEEICDGRCTNCSGDD